MQLSFEFEVVTLFSGSGPSLLSLLVISPSKWILLPILQEAIPMDAPTPLVEQLIARPLLLQMYALNWPLLARSLCHAALHSTFNILSCPVLSLFTSLLCLNTNNGTSKDRYYYM
jgi:hypothetical protein